jgi:heme-degrading monooxygenase HmoA
MQVQPGREADFEAAWRQVAAVTKSAPGNLRQALLRALDDPSTFIISSDWASREAFGQFEKSPEQDDLTAPIRELRVSASMRIDELVEHVEAADAADAAD